MIRLIWNIACDYAINLIVIDAGLVLPQDRFFDEKYRNWTVDAIYDDLIKNMPPVTEHWCFVGSDGDRWRRPR